MPFPRSGKASLRPAMSSTAMSVLNTAGQKVEWIDCRRSRANSCALRSQ